MHIGVLGAGRIGQAIAHYFVLAGHEVVLANSRGPASLKPLVQGLGEKARAGSSADVAAAPVMFLCVMWEQIPDALAGLGPFDGRIVVDANNPLRLVDGKPQVTDLGGRPSSDIVAELVPGARLVKAFNTVVYTTLAQSPLVNGGRRVMFVSGDNPDAKEEIGSLIAEIGFAPLDLGTLAAGGQLQQAGGPLATKDLVLFS